MRRCVALRANRIKNTRNECSKGTARKSNKHFHLSSGDHAAYTQFVKHFVSLLLQLVASLSVCWFSCGVEFGSVRFGCKLNLL